MMIIYNFNMMARNTETTAMQLSGQIWAFCECDWLKDEEGEGRRGWKSSEHVFCHSGCSVRTNRMHWRHLTLVGLQRPRMGLSVLIILYHCVNMYECKLSPINKQTRCLFLTNHLMQLNVCVYIRSHLGSWLNCIFNTLELDSKKNKPDR